MLRGFWTHQARSSLAGGRACLPDDTLVVAIGDVHGRADLLEQLWQQVTARVARSSCRHKVLIFLGDYVDRGTGSAAVVERMVRGFDGFECIFLRGNHEQVLLQFLLDPSVGDTWKQFGGIATLQSYGVHVEPQPDWAETRAAFMMALPPAHLDFLKNLRPYHVLGDYLFVHAGVRPHVRLEDQSERDLLWIREDFLESDASFGHIVVHGHTPTRAPEVRENRIGIDTGAFFTGKLTALLFEGRDRHLLST